MFTVGPHTFTEHDAQRTVAAHDTVWQLLCEGRDATVLAPLAPLLTGDLEHDLGAVWTAWQAAGPALRAAGQLPATAHGVVEGLHVSNGGLPKTAVLHAAVGWRGLDGDRQATRQHHGRPFQALCLWSAEVIDAFRAQGHPLAPGLAGENVTVRGLPWPDVRPGVELLVGTVRCAVSSYAIPCSQNKGWFLDGQYDLMHHRHGPVSRVYATVLEPGHIAVGDTIVLEP